MKLASVILASIFATTIAADKVVHTFLWYATDCSSAPDYAAIRSETGSCTASENLPCVPGSSASSRSSCSPTRDASPLNGKYMVATSGNTQTYQKVGKCMPGGGSGSVMFDCTSTNITQKQCTDANCQTCTTTVIPTSSTYSCETMTGASGIIAVPVTFIFAACSLITAILL